MGNSEFNFIGNYQLLTDYFGYFPNFHDDEMTDIQLMRDGCNLKVTISSFQNKDKKTTIVLLFEKICNLLIEDFNHQNVIFNLEIIKEQDEYISVNFESSFGASIRLKCKHINVQSLK